MPARRRAETPEERAARRRRRVSHVERTYGITEAQLEALEAYQADQLGAGRTRARNDAVPARCWGCGIATGATKALAVDHNHRTGEVRMLLCGPCNQLVGRFKDNPVALVRLGLALVQPPSRAAWAAGALPGWSTDDPGLIAWLDGYRGRHDEP
jgi:recombination endonuclease VII